MKKRPNVLFLMTDEHRADVTGFAGNTVVRTPNLDRLANSGVVFTNAYTPSPICVPGRQSMMAGQFPRHTGCEKYGQDLPPGHMTFARRFSQFGYNTVACGKLHHTGTDPLQGWTKRIGSEVGLSPSNIEGRNEEAFSMLPKKPNLKWSQAKEVRRAGMGRAPQVINDEYTVLGALNFIDNFFLSPYYDRATPEQPLMLKVSLGQPHYPYAASEEKFRYYLNRVEPFVNQEPLDHPCLSRFHVKLGQDVSEREIRRATAAYYAMVETADEHFGRILEALEQAGQNLDEWIIVFASDHGEMLGEHGVWEKQVFYEGSVKVPLLIRWPERFAGGRVIEQNVNLCDLFATLCDLVDIPVQPDLDSRSLVPLLLGNEAAWDNETISQFDGTDLMIKRDHLKYQYYGPNIPEVLFDLKANPQETINYIHHPDYQQDIAKFRLRTQELGFGNG